MECGAFCILRYGYCLYVFWCFFGWVFLVFFGSLDISHLVSHSKLLNKNFSENLNF